MSNRHVTRLAAAIGSGLACSAAGSIAAALTATVEIPQLDVAEYHRPYVAIWIEGADKIPTNVAVWYDVDMRNDEGETWLKDLRQWWRKSGRELDLPVDGVSGPTRPVGVHEVKIAAAITDKLRDGDYELVVEAVREVGGRELVRVPFTWSRTAKVDVNTRGERELGTITLRSAK
jgi:hypothetical protein